ncbi:TetR/AcrR family transcriptional regulator [Halomonas shantousis]
MQSDYEAFKDEISLSKSEICSELFHQNSDLIRIKKERVAVKNLIRIIDSTLRLANSKGFQAMTLRDLCNDSGLSMGGLYSYIKNKDDLLQLIQNHGFILTRRTLLKYTRDVTPPREKLFVAIRTHLYLSELMRAWFYFSYMEAKSLPQEEKQKAIAVELEIENIFEAILREGIETGVFQPVDTRLIASFIKALLQDWYIKRRKYRDQQLDVTEYAQAVRELIESRILATAA